MKLIVSKPYEEWNEFEKSTIPILPVLDFPKLSYHGRNCSKCYSPFLQNKAISFISARYALSALLRLSGIDSSGSVLMPSYHCLSMIAPVVWSGIKIEFYKLNTDLSINFDDIKKKLSTSTRAILVVHYFGFPQQISNLMELCRKYKIRLIEDCAHAFLGFNESKIGINGDFAVASMKKFFPASDGGMLLINSKDISYENTNVSAPTPLKVKDELKKTKNLLEESFFYQRLKPISTLFNGVSNLNFFKSNEYGKQFDSKNEASDCQKIMSWFNPVCANKRASITSRVILKNADIDLISNRRRQNYLYLLSNLDNLKTVRPFKQKLPIDVIPYMFPLILNDPMTHFKRLKLRKIPIWRWEELCISECETSQYLSEHLIQLPCHQDLRKGEMDEIIHAIKDL